MGRWSTATVLLASVVTVGWPAASNSIREVELVRDPHFRRGFVVSAPEPGQHVVAGVVRADPRGRYPVWRLTQWSSRFPLTDFAPRPGPQDTLAIGNQAKLVRIGRPGTPYGDLTLAVRGRLEYGGCARGPKDPWVHLLVDQEFVREAWLSDLSALRLHLEVRVSQCRRARMAHYDPSIHAAQVPLFISIQNRDPASVGFGDYYHFGIPLFDNRQRMPTGLVAGDPGTGKLMYCPPASKWTSASTHGGQWVTYSGDLLPEVLKGLQAAWERGFLPDSQQVNDYRPAGLCVGWEVPGLFDVSCQLRNVSLRAAVRR